jgi:DNA-binding beta-propeller fold protein YncE
VRFVHNVQQYETVEDMGKKLPKIYAALDNKQAEFQSHMIEVEGNINNQPISSLIDSGSSHGYIDPKMVERFQLPKRKLRKPWLVQLAIEAKRKINEMVKECPMKMNGMNTKADLNIIPLGSYDYLIGMDWLDKNHYVLECYNKSFSFLDEEGNVRTIQGIPRSVTIREVSAL